MNILRRTTVAGSPTIRRDHCPRCLALERLVVRRVWRVLSLFGRPLLTLATLGAYSTCGGCRATVLLTGRFETRGWGVVSRAPVALARQPRSSELSQGRLSDRRLEAS